LGGGRVRRDSPVKPFHVRDNPSVIEFADWHVETEPSMVAMAARHVFGRFAADLERRVSVKDRVVTSHSTVRNTGEETLPLRWFAHPFFPWASAVCRLSLECSVPSNPGFSMGADGLLRRNEMHDWNVGCYQPLQLCYGFPLRIEQKHPMMGTVEIACDFPVAWLPMWGNAATVSPEPYYHTVLEPGSSAEWSIRYRF